MVTLRSLKHLAGENKDSRRRFNTLARLHNQDPSIALGPGAKRYVLQGGLDCGFLKKSVTRKQLAEACKVLEIEFTEKDRKNELCLKIKEQRPDLLRSKARNILWSMLKVIASSAVASFIINSVLAYAMGEEYSAQMQELLEDPNKLNTFSGVNLSMTALMKGYTAMVGLGYFSDSPYAMGDGKLAIQRRKARKILGL